MEKYKYVIPEEAQDTRIENVKLLRKMENQLRHLFEQYQYVEVMLPTFEYTDLYRKLASGIEVERLFQFFNKEGKSVALRGDFTFPLARLFASTHEVMSRYCYFGRVYRKQQRHKGRASEIYQAGIELMGIKEDKEIMEILSKSIQDLELQSVKVNLSSAKFFNRLETLFDVNQELKSILAKRDVSRMERFVKMNIHDTQDQQLLLALPLAFGKKEIFKIKEFVKDELLKIALEELEEVYEKNKEKFEDVNIDLAMIPKFEYYTGLMIEGYMQSVASPILSGGRYDQLVSEFSKPSPAIGFSFNLSLLSEAKELI